MTIYKEDAFDVVKNCKIDIDRLDSIVYDQNTPQDFPLNYKNWYKIVDTSGNVIAAATYMDTTNANEYYQFNIDVRGAFFNQDCCTSNPPHELLCDSTQGLNVYCVEVHTMDYDENHLSSSIPDYIFDEAISMLPLDGISTTDIMFDIAKLGLNFVAVDVLGKESCTAIAGAYGGYYVYENRDHPDFSEYDPTVLTVGGAAIFGGAEYLFGIVAEHVNPIIKKTIGLN